MNSAKREVVPLYEFILSKLGEQYIPDNVVEVETNSWATLLCGLLRMDTPVMAD